MAGDLRYSITTDVTGSVSPLQKLQSEVTKTQASFTDLKTAIGGLAIGAFVTSAFQLADSLSDISDASGMALKNVMGFSSAIAASGGSVDGALTGIGRFNQALASAADGSKQSQNAFLSLGITFKELETLSEQDLLRRTVQGLANTGDAAKRTALQVDIFGKSFASVDFTKVNANLDEFIKKSGVSAASVKAAGDASDNFASAFKKLQIELLAALEPISKLAASINTAGEAFGSFIKIIVQIGTVVASFFILGRAVALVTAGFSAISAGAAAIGTGFTVVVNLFRNFGAVTGQLNSIGGIFVGTLKVLRGYLGDLGAFAVKSIPGLGALGVSLSFVADYASDAYDKLKQLFGLEDPRNAEAGNSRGTRDPKFEKEAAEAREVEAAKLREIKTENQKIASEMQKILQAYKETNAEANKKFALDTAAINQTDKQKLAAQERFAAEKTFNQELSKLQDQINQRRQSGTPVDLAVIPQLEEAQKKLTQQYQIQKTAIDGLVDSRIKDERAKQASLFATQSFIGLQLEADRLAERSAMQLLPLQAKGYLEVELAARRSAEAAIAAEEARRGEKLDAREATTYYQAARQGIESVKTAQDAFNATLNVEKLRVFANESLNELQNKSNDLAKQSALMLLPLQAKGYAEIELAAMAAAKAKIQAEEVRRGEKLDPAEQAEYYKAARQGIEETKAAQDELNITTEKYNLLQFSLRSQFDLQKKIRDIQHEMGTATLSGIAKKYADIEKAARDAAEAQIQAEEVRTGKELDENQRKAYYETARKGIEELKQAETESYEASRNGLTGLKKALNDYVDDATNAAKNVENVFRKATQGMEDMIVKFAKTGKFEFKEFVNSMLEDLLRSQIRQTMANLFTMSGNQVKGGGGGLFGGSIIPGILAAGGPVSDRRPYIVGERGPELFVPNSAGSMVPNSGLTGGNTVTYNISAVDAMSFKQMIAKDPSFIHAVAMQGGRTVPARR